MAENPTPMTYGARVHAARTPSEFTDQVTAALAGHARYVAEAGNQSHESKVLAAMVARAPEEYTRAMALMVLRLPVSDDLISTDELGDADVQARVGEAWTAFVAPATG